MRVAYQGEPGAFSEAAVLRLLPDAEPRPFPTFEEVFDAVHDRSREPRRRADRELHRRVDPPQLRPAGRSASCRSSARCRCRWCTTCWRCRACDSRKCGGCSRIRRRWRSARGFLRTLKDVEAIATYDTAGSAKMVRDEQRRDTAAIASGARRQLFGLEALTHRRPGLRRQHHALPRDRPRSACRSDRPTRRRVVFTLQERAGRAVQGAERLRAPRHRSDQARVAAGAGPAVGIPVLRRCRGRARGSALRPRDRASGRVRRLAAHARVVSALARARGGAARRIAACAGRGTAWLTTRSGR